MGNEGGSIPVETIDPSFSQQLVLEGQLHDPLSFEVNGPPLNLRSREGRYDSLHLQTFSNIRHND